MSNNPTSAGSPTRVTLDGFIEEARDLAKARGLSGFSLVAACGESVVLVTDTDKDPIEALGLLKMCEVAVAQGIDGLINKLALHSCVSVDLVREFADNLIEQGNVTKDVAFKSRTGSGAGA